MNIVLFGSTITLTVRRTLSCLRQATKLVKGLEKKMYEEWVVYVRLV